MKGPKKAGWRSDETHAAYVEKINQGHLEKKCRICDNVPIKEYEHWQIISNRFPYDRIASVHQMLVPKRHTDGSDLTTQKLDELEKIKHGTFDHPFTHIAEALPQIKSIPAHLHFHLLAPRDF